MTRQSKRKSQRDNTLKLWLPCINILDALGFEKGRGPVFNYEDTDAVILHSKLAAAVIDTMLSVQKAMSASKQISC